MLQTLDIEQFEFKHLIKTSPVTLTQPKQTLGSCNIEK